MFESKLDPKSPNFFSDLQKEVLSLVDGEPNLVANLANVSASIFYAFPHLNWCGFYLRDTPEVLVLGPFQGKPACIRIRKGKGVCGTSFAEENTIRVDNVDTFPGHIACDSASKSELVVPLLKNGQCYGVLDLDSPELNRFSEADAQGFTEMMNALAEKIF